MGNSDMHWLIVLAVPALLIYVIIKGTRRGASARTLNATLFRNPANGYVEEVRLAWFWSLLFGFFYFAVKGIWTHAVAGLVLALLTFGISWLVYPFFAQQIVERHYLRRGWIPVEARNSIQTDSARHRISVQDER